jgi:hypothetical protein
MATLDRINDPNEHLIEIRTYEEHTANDQDARS